MSPPPADGKSSLVRRVLQLALREDVAGLRSRGRLLDGSRWVAGDVSFPARAGGFLADVTAGEPALDVPTLLAAIGSLEPDDEPLQAGLREFAAECAEAARAVRLRTAHWPGTRRRLGTERPGPAGAVWYDALAAQHDHPLYPTSAARPGWSDDDVLAYAPEHHRPFALRWIAVPAAGFRRFGRLPGWWPPTGSDDTVAVPVHPLTDRPEEPLDGPDVRVVATLSTRTVALLDEPRTHLKLPLATSTLGRRNRRALHPGPLHDGAAVEGLLRRIAPDGLLLADESTFGHGGSGRVPGSGDPMLGYLLRRWPAWPERATVVPVAALTADRPDGTPVFEALAGRAFAGDLEAFLRAYLRVLFRVHLQLWLQHGVALEAHQQNTALVLDGDRIRLLLKDNDTPRLDPDLLAAHADVLDGLRDRRIVDGGPQRLADMVTTIVLHLCAAAVCVGVAERRGEPRGRWLRLVREELVAAAEPYRGCRDFPLLQRILDAPRLPVKSMATAGTLLPKERTGAVDVNTWYGTTAPNYLLDPC